MAVYPRLHTIHYNSRPPGIIIDTVVIHSMYNPVDSPTLRFSVLDCKKLLDEAKVSSHYVIGRTGECFLLVPEVSRAWHAGVSKMPNDGREGVNDFSIGIELIGDETSGFTDRQYRSLENLTQDIASRHPIRSIVGHSEIAPDRKSDPHKFDWQRYIGAVQGVLPSAQGGV